VTTYQEERERRMSFMRQKAAQTWCAPETANIEMDSRLAEEFAKILLEESYASHLGCATTRELLEELTARSDLDYATVEPLLYNPEKSDGTSLASQVLPKKNMSDVSEGPQPR
jgi:hypothetical protein